MNTCKQMENQLVLQVWVMGWATQITLKLLIYEKALYIYSWKSIQLKDCPLKPGVQLNLGEILWKVLEHDQTVGNARETAPQVGGQCLVHVYQFLTSSTFCPLIWPKIIKKFTKARFWLIETCVDICVVTIIHSENAAFRVYLCHNLDFSPLCMDLRRIIDP